MSITFTPNAGTWTSFNYYESDEDELTGLPIPNGVTAFDNEEPSVQCHNSGGLMLIERLAIVPIDQIGEAYCGSIEADEIPGLFANLMRVIGSDRDLGVRDDYAQRKFAAFREMLLHCRYHQCGFSWG